MNCRETARGAEPRKLSNRPARIIFITGTDTGVGKTVLTSLLLYHLRRRGRKALGMKPFCSGSRGDALLLDRLQDHVIPLDEINPFYFATPVAPYIAARLAGRRVILRDVVRAVNHLRARCDVLVVEGAGGLLVPLGEHFSVLDLIVALRCEVVVVARNRLGTINHTLLTVQALRQAGIRRVRVVLMNPKTQDVSCQTNFEVLSELLPSCRAVLVPFLAGGIRSKAGVEKNYKKVQKTLAQVVE